MAVTSGRRDLPGSLAGGSVARPAGRGGLVFALGLAGYLSFAWILVFGHNLIEGDAYSRVANAYYVLYSRDPHLAAIGFVWNPLPSLTMLLVLPLKALWPALVTDGFAANIVSSVFMAAAVYQLNQTLAEARLGRIARGALLVLFAAQPLILYSGSNGLSEAPILFFLFFTIRYLARWLRQDDLPALVLAGTGLGFAYLDRYEALPAGMVVVACVAAVSFGRCPGSCRQRAITALYDVTICGGPLLLSFMIWTLASWIIVGHPFEQIQSVYGNSSQAKYFASARPVATAAVGPLTPLLWSWLGQALVRTLLLQPVLPPLLILAAGVACWRRSLAVLASISVLGGALLFTVTATALDVIGPLNRYYIWAIPLAIFVAAETLGALRTHRAEPPAGSRATQKAGSGDGSGRPSRPGRGPWMAAGRAAIGLVTIAGLATSFPSAAWLMLNPRLSNESAGLSMLNQHPGVLHEYQTSQTVAHYLDHMNLGSGTVILDVFTGYPIVLRSDNPHQFVITSDQDFEVKLADPAGTGVEYLLVPRDEPLDALNRRYPSLYRNGAGIASLVREFRSPSDPGAWRLYRIRSVPASAPQ